MKTLGIAIALVFALTCAIYTMEKNRPSHLTTATPNTSNSKGQPASKALSEEKQPAENCEKAAFTLATYRVPASIEAELEHYIDANSRHDLYKKIDIYVITKNIGCDKGLTVRYGSDRKGLPGVLVSVISGNYINAFTLNPAFFLTDDTDKDKIKAVTMLKDGNSLKVFTNLSLETIKNKMSKEEFYSHLTNIINDGVNAANVDFQRANSWEGIK